MITFKRFLTWVELIPSDLIWCRLKNNIDWVFSHQKGFIQEKAKVTSSGCRHGKPPGLHAKMEKGRKRKENLEP